MVVALMHETFDTASHFEVTNADGIVPFFTDGYSDYFGIHNGVGTSAFQGRTELQADTDNPATTFGDALPTGLYSTGGGFTGLDGVANVTVFQSWPFISALAGMCARVCVSAPCLRSRAVLASVGKATGGGHGQNPSTGRKTADR